LGLVFDRCECAAGYFGPFCKALVMVCEDCVATWRQSHQSHLYGIGLEQLTHVTMAGHNLPFNVSTVDLALSSKLQEGIKPWPAAVRTAAAHSMQHISFRAPALNKTNPFGPEVTITTVVQSLEQMLLLSGAGRSLLSTDPPSAVDSAAIGASGHVPFVLGIQTEISLSTSDISQFPFSSADLRAMFFFTDSECREEGTFGTDGQGGCRGCPKGQEHHTYTGAAALSCLQSPSSCLCIA
jgi:hypothetical protein